MDADACPVKEEIYRVAKRYRLAVTLVANSRMGVPEEEWVTLVVVGAGADVADDWIASRVAADDVVVTGDIRLAARCLDAGARVLGLKGRAFTEENVSDAVATRDLLAVLREEGTMSRGPAPFTPADRSRFLQGLDQMVQAIRRGRAGG